MDLVLLAKALVLGIIEGLTEFLPVSSTGHLILAGDLLGFDDEKAKVFEIVIQTGAMLAIVWEYRAKFSRVLAGLASDRAAQRFALNLVVAFIPAAVLGLAFGKLIKTYLFHAVPVALAFIVGAFIILWVERRERHAVVQSVEDMTWKDALKVGIAQAFALIPGTSRSGATIIGGRCRDVRGRLGRCVRVRFPLRTLAAALHRHARLHAVRVVPDRFRRGGPRYGLRGGRQLVSGIAEGRADRARNVDQPWTQGKPANRQPPTVPRWPCGSFSPSNPSSTL